MNTKELQNAFSKLVRDINTRNIKWKEHIGMIDWQLKNYLNNEIYHKNIMQYELTINRIGQSIIECNIKYTEKYYDTPKCITFQERVKTPMEVCKSMLFAVENAIIQKNKRESIGMSWMLLNKQEI